MVNETTESADLLIIGGGLAGYTAAVAALEQGARVVLVEKGPTPGGTSVRSGGSFAFAGTDMQVAQGVADSPEVLREDLMRDGGESVDPALVDLYVREQLPTYEWLRGLGVNFDLLSHSGGQSQPRSHGTSIKTVFALMRSAANDNPRFTEIVSESAIRLILEDGRVVGVTTAGEQGEVDRYAAATLLTTGGFSRGARAIATFAPALSHARPMGGLYNTGDGIYLSMSAGADLADVGEIKATYGVSAELPGIPEEPTLLNALYRGGIIVNQLGRRFVDESITDKQMGRICLEQPGAVGFQIFDAKVMAQTLPYPPLNNYQGALDAGYVVRADTVRELAEAIGIDPDALERTVGDYNTRVANGEPDPDFGRSSIVSGYGDLATIEEGPFYAFPSTSGVTTTYGGVRVDDEMRVRHVMGGTIPGLYAAGELVGGFHGHDYMAGSSLGKTAIFGRVAGLRAAAVTELA